MQPSNSIQVSFNGFSPSTSRHSANMATQRVCPGHAAPLISSRQSVLTGGSASDPVTTPSVLMPYLLLSWDRLRSDHLSLICFSVFTGSREARALFTLFTCLQPDSNKSHSLSTRMATSSLDQHLRVVLPVTCARQARPSCLRASSTCWRSILLLFNSTGCLCCRCCNNTCCHRCPKNGSKGD